MRAERIPAQRLATVAHSGGAKKADLRELIPDFIDGGRSLQTWTSDAVTRVFFVQSEISYYMLVSNRRPLSSERITDADPSQDLPVIHVLGPEHTASQFCGSLNHHCVPEMKLGLLL